MCLYTRYIIAVPIVSKRASDVAEALFTHTFAVHGLSSTVRSDEGKEFVNAGLTTLYQQWGTQSTNPDGRISALGKPRRTVS
jgi:hypothetical protein